MLGSGFPGIAAVSPWAKPQPGSAPGTDTSKLEELARLPGVSPQLAALLHDKERIQDILAKDPAARGALARAARATNPEDQPLKELRGILETYIGQRKTSAGSIADKLRARQNEIADLRLEWANIKASLMGDCKKDKKCNPYWEQWKQYWKVDLGAPYGGYWVNDGGVEKTGLKFGLDRTGKIYDLIESVGGVDPRGDCPRDWDLFIWLFPAAGHEANEEQTDSWYEGPSLGSLAGVIYRRISKYFMVPETGIDSLDARITAMCDKAQLEVDKLNQEFKNEMTLVNSARTELHDLSKDIVSLSKGF